MSLSTARVVRHQRDGHEYGLQSVLTITDHANLSKKTLFTTISKKSTGENVAVTNWDSSDLDDHQKHEYFLHSSLEYLNRRTVLHTFCPSMKLCGEQDLIRRFLTRIHPEKCSPVDLLNYEMEMAAENDPVILTQDNLEESGHQSDLPNPISDNSISRPSNNIEAHEIPITRAYGRSRLGKKRRRPDKKRTESEIFQDALADYTSNFGHLCTMLNNAPLRVTHFFEDSRCFAFASAHTVLSANSERKCHPVISIIWQTSERPKRAVAISFSIHPSSNTLRGTCTCKAIRSIARDDASCCEHLSSCYQNVELIDKMEESLRRQRHYFQSHGHSIELFGEPIQIIAPSETTSFHALCMTRFSVVSQAQETNRNRRSYSWVFWIVFDTQTFMFVPVLKVKGKPFQCLACRLDCGRRGICNHERACRRTSNTDDSDDDNELSPSEAERNESNSEEPNPMQPQSTQQQLSYNMGRDLYVSNTTRRSVLLCESEVQATEGTARMIETLDSNECLVLHEKNMAKCLRCGALNTSEPSLCHRRQVNIFTLSQGTIGAEVYDWFCKNCQEKKLFSGQFHGIFPARKESCYTTELMYAWSQMVCLHGFSFREAYRNVKLTSGAERNTLRFRDKGRDNYDETKENTRKRANEAFRAFLKTVKTDCSTFTGKAFSCSECEVPLTAEDCAQLDIDPQRSADLRLKRFKAIVIDGTAAGILKKLPKYARDFKALRETRVAKSKLVTLEPQQKSLSALIKMCTESVRTLRRRKRGLSSALRSTSVSWWLLHNTSEDTSLISCKKTTMKAPQARLAMMLCEENPCFCGTTDESHSTECVEHLNNFKEPIEAVSSILQSVFSISCCPPPALGTSEQHSEINHATSINISGDRNEGEHEQDHGSDEGDEQDDAEDYGEHVERESHPTEDAQQETSSDAAVASNTESAMHTTENTSTPFWATIKVPHGDLYADFIESLMGIIRFTILEHIGLPYMTRLSFESVGIEPPLSAAHQPHQSIMSSAICAVNLHKKVVDALKKYITCNRHGSQTQVPWEDCSCVEEIKKWSPLLQDVNPVLETFCIQVIKLARPLHQQLVEIIERLCILLETHMSRGVLFLRKVDRKMSSDSKEYWENCKFNEVRLHEGETDDEFNWNEVGMCFPGRSRCRPGITFERIETHLCTKRYPKSETHTPGLLTVQCACESPKLIGFIVMTRAESTSLALSAILMYFPLPPRTVYYDNACNLYASIFLRIPWLLSRTRVAVDRFHYKSHTCSPFFCPDSYQTLDMQRTETAESFNARIEKSLYHMRFLGPENLIPFLYNRFALLNISALFKEQFNRQDLEDENLAAFLRSIYQCPCTRCDILRQSRITTEQIASDGAAEPNEEDNDATNERNAQHQLTVEVNEADN